MSQVIFHTLLAMARSSRKILLLIAAIGFVLLVLGLLVSTSNTARQFQWLTESPGNKPPHFKFLGRWGWTVNGWFMRLTHKRSGPPRSNRIAFTLYLIDSTDGLVPASEVAWRTTNHFGDQAWLLRRSQSIKAVARDNEDFPKSSSISFGEGHQAQVASYVTAPLYRRGETNAVMVDIGYWFNASGSTDRGGFAYTFFLMANERVTTSEGQLVQTNALLGGRLHIPDNHVLLLISGRTNSHGQYMAAHIAPSVAP